MLSVRLGTRLDCQRMIQSHYLKCWPGVTVLIHVLTNDNHPEGVIVYALPPRETSKRYGCTTWELARLWVDDRMPRNTESWFISRSIKWLKKNKKDVGCLVSYADPSAGHKGTIYRASNWIFDGMTDEERKTPRFDYEANGKRYSRRSHVPKGSEIKRIPRVSKYRFFYWLQNDFTKRTVLYIPSRSVDVPQVP